MYLLQKYWNTINKGYTPTCSMIGYTYDAVFYNVLHNFASKKFNICLPGSFNPALSDIITTIVC